MANAAMGDQVGRIPNFPWMEKIKESQTIDHVQARKPKHS